MSQQHNQAIVASLVAQCAEDLFNAYEVKIARQPGLAPPEMGETVFAGVIGFTGPVMRGTLVLAPTATLLERSHQGANCEFRDWAGELANQLIGRLKNQLRAYGVEVHVSTPVVIKGFQLASVPRGELTLHCFAASPGNVAVWFDAQVEAGVTLEKQNEPAGPVEGDAIIF